ncbi:MAG: ATP-binding protein [Hymenobacter sp.]
MAAGRRSPPDAQRSEGASKTTLAERFPDCFPTSTDRGVLGLTAIYSLSGRDCRRAGPMIAAPTVSVRRTTRRPGPACSVAAPAGSGRARSAGRTLGALFLDEFRCSAPTSSRRCGSRWRAARSRSPAARSPTTFPARTMVVIACNPCPCGDYHPTNRDNRCTRARSCPAPGVPQEAQRPGHRPDRHHPARRARAGLMRPRDPLARSEPSAPVRERVTRGPGAARPSATSGTGVAAERRRARAQAAHRAGR